MKNNKISICLQWPVGGLLNQILLLIGFLTYCIGYGQSNTEKEIMKSFRLEEEYWNKGDIEAYVSLYAPEDSVRMLYSTGATYGRDNILAFYKKYWPKEKMGTLTLDDERIEILSDKYCFVSGKFHVSYPDGNGKPVNGRFSGLMKKIKGKWYIYTDHSG